MHWLVAIAFVLGQNQQLDKVGQLTDPGLKEVSGIVASRVHSGVFWVHNDSGNPNDLYAISLTGKTLGRFRIPGVHLDWEDIAIDAQGRIYLGDIGNNNERLPLRTVYRFEEPNPTAAKPVAKVERCVYRFPASGRFDAESLFVEGEQVYLIAKYLDGREAQLFAFPFNPQASPLNPVVPRLLGNVPGFTEPATVADLSADCRLLAVCSPSVTRVYERDPQGRLTMVGAVRYKERQVEAIAWDRLDLILTDEPGTLFRLPRSQWQRRPQAKPEEGRHAR